MYKDQGNGIIDDLANFKKAVFDYNGDQHKPNYLVISWGALLFKGILTDLSIEYKLFKSDGTPLRAVAKVKFISHIEAEKRAAAENNQSPDLTHVRMVKEGDTLPLMTHRIYGDPKYYLEVAKVNNLSNFRSLTPGTKLYFPPLAKKIIMNNSGVIQTSKSDDLITFKLLTEGEELSNAYEIKSIGVTKQVNKVPTAKIVLIGW